MDKIFNLIQKEGRRQKYGLELIPSENYVSGDVLRAMGSVLTNKYSEGYPGRRYYGGNQFIDDIEKLCQERAKKLFSVPYVNVQPYSGSPANFAVYLAVLKKGETFMGLDLPSGGHLTHGWKASATSYFYKSVPYHVGKNGFIDMDEVWRLARDNKPGLIWAGATAYSQAFDFARFAEIADEVGAFFAADIAHIAGLIIAGFHTNPAPYAHIITTTTHKTLRGPRGAMIMVTNRGIKKDPALPQKIDRAVFPGLQGGPHNHIIAGIAVALKEASSKDFKRYAGQIIKNAQALADALLEEGFDLVSGGTLNHMILIDLRPLGKGKGIFAQEALEEAGITVNKNTVPGESSSAFYPSGLRLGTPAITSRGMKEKEMKKIASWIKEVIWQVKDYEIPRQKENISQVLRKFREDIRDNKVIGDIAGQVRKLCSEFPVPGIDD